MGREKKSAGTPLADLIVDYGPEMLYFFPPDPEALVGLFFCADRVQLRRMGHQILAIEMALGGSIPEEVFVSMAESEEEGRQQYQRYLAHQRVSHASGAFGKTI